LTTNITYQVLGLLEWRSIEQLGPNEANGIPFQLSQLGNKVKLTKYHEEIEHSNAKGMIKFRWSPQGLLTGEIENLAGTDGHYLISNPGEKIFAYGIVAAGASQEVKFPSNFQSHYELGMLFLGTRK
jgi:hypothetical protein